MSFLFFTATATTQIYTLSLHDALPISAYFIMRRWLEGFAYHIDLRPWMFLAASALALVIAVLTVIGHALLVARAKRSEEHTSELQSRPHLVCRLLLEKKNILKTALLSS